MHSVLVVCSAWLAMLGGCSREPAATDDVDIADAAATARASVGNYAALPRSVTRQRVATTNRTDGPLPQASPAVEDPASAAAAVVTLYYSLIGEGRYAPAWRLWGQDGQASGMDEESFAASFAKYASYRAVVGPPGPIDAGAGQRYVTVPVRVSGRLKDGDRPFAMEGPVTLHRAADIDGATPAQRRWRIGSSGVRPRPDEATPASDPKAPDRVTARYRCDDGTAFTAVFDNRADVVTLRFGGRFGAGDDVRLPGQRPASGIWYRNPRYELRGKGRAATLTRGRAMPVDCTATG